MEFLLKLFLGNLLRKRLGHFILDLFNSGNAARDEGLAVQMDQLHQGLSEEVVRLGQWTGMILLIFDHRLTLLFCQVGIVASFSLSKKR